MNMISIILAFLLVSCGTKTINTLTSKPVALPQYKVVEHVVYPGKVKKLRISQPEVGSDHELICGDKKLSSLKNNDQIEAFFSVNYKYLEKNKNKIIPCYVNSLIGGQRLNFHVFNLHVKPFNYPKSFIKVAKKHVDLSPEDLQRFLGEKEIINKVYEVSMHTPKLFKKDFIKPLKSKITGVYGSRRVFNNKKDSWHSGTDFRARTPIPIPSSNDGVVAFAGDLFFNGNAVFVDHGMGIITMYCHLSKINVKIGDRVDQGTIIGLSGNTGRSSAPHLHWGVRVQNHWIDGLQFLQEQKEEGLVAYHHKATDKK
jgi:murein DD-endopeptidase MepM/ murein hydrolase activator NlpD